MTVMLMKMVMAAVVRPMRSAKTGARDQKAPCWAPVQKAPTTAMGESR